MSSQNLEDLPVELLRNSQIVHMVDALLGDLADALVGQVCDLPFSKEPR
jgi:hypothetical protein